SSTPTSNKKCSRGEISSEETSPSKGQNFKTKHDRDNLEIIVDLIIEIEPESDDLIIKFEYRDDKEIKIFEGKRTEIPTELIDPLIQAIASNGKYKGKTEPFIRALRLQHVSQ